MSSREYLPPLTATLSTSHLEAFVTVRYMEEANNTLVLDDPLRNKCGDSNRRFPCSAALSLHVTPSYNPLSKFTLLGSQTLFLSSPSTTILLPNKTGQPTLPWPFSDIPPCFCALTHFLHVTWKVSHLLCPSFVWKLLQRFSPKQSWFLWEDMIKWCNTCKIP